MDFDAEGIIDLAIASLLYVVPAALLIAIDFIIARFVFKALPNFHWWELGTWLLPLLAYDMLVVFAGIGRKGASILHELFALGMLFGLLFAVRLWLGIADSQRNGWYAVGVCVIVLSLAIVIGLFMPGYGGDM